MKLSELLEDVLNEAAAHDPANNYTAHAAQSTPSQEAAKLGLEYYSFGRWGKGGKVTHKSQNGQLVPVDPKMAHRSSIHPKVPSDTEGSIRNPNMIKDHIARLERNINFEKERLATQGKNWSSSAKIAVWTQIDRMEQALDILYWHQAKNQSNTPPDAPVAPQNPTP